MAVRLGPARPAGGLVMLFGALMFAGSLIIVQTLWRTSALGLLTVLFFMPVPIGAAVLFLLGLAIFSNEIVWKIDSTGVSCESRLSLKREIWFEPLRNYAWLRMVNSAQVMGGPPQFEIALEHSTDDDKHVTLYASTAYHEFRTRGREVAALLGKPLKEAKFEQATAG